MRIIWSWLNENRSILFRMCMKDDFYIFIPSDLDHYP